MKYKLILISVINAAFIYNSNAANINSKPSKGQVSTQAIYSQVGIKNVNSYTLLLSGKSWDGAYCGTGTSPGTCWPQLEPSSGTQWFSLTYFGAWAYIDYDVCDSINYDSGNPACEKYIGHVGINIATWPQNLVTIGDAQGGTATLSPYIAGQPYSLTFTPPPPPPPYYSYPTSIKSYNNGIAYRGVNFGAFEFTPYAVPAISDGAYYAGKGMNTIRLPFVWERLQPNLNVPIDFNSNYVKQYVDTVNGYTSKGISVIIDMHNYMRYQTSSGEQIIGAAGSSVTTAQYAAAWEQIANKFKTNSKVIFGLMNEPHDMTTELVLNNYKAALTKIRGVGASNLALLAGNGWDGASNWGLNWYGTPNSVVFTPANIGDSNYAIEVHQYFDSVGSGVGDCNVTPDLTDLNNYFTAHKVRAMLTETGGIKTQQCANSINNFLQALRPYNANTGGFIGWTGWAGGANSLEMTTYFGPESYTAASSATITMTQGFQPNLTLP